MKVSYLNNSTMMDVEFLPEHCIVIGAAMWDWICPDVSPLRSDAWRFYGEGPRLIHVKTRYFRKHKQFSKAKVLSPSER